MPAGEIARRGHWLDQRLSRSRSPSTRLAARTVQTRTLRTPSRTTTKQTGVPPQTSQECYGWSQPLQLSFKSYSVYCRNWIASMRQLCLLGEQRSHSETCDFPAGSSVLRSLNHQSQILPSGSVAAAAFVTLRVNQTFFSHREHSQNHLAHGFRLRTY